VSPEALNPDSLTLAIEIDAVPVAVWRVLTEPGLIGEWMSDTPITVTSEWRVGAAIRFSGAFHGMAFENHGQILAWDPPAVFAYDYWSTLSAERLADTPENRVRLRFDLTAVGGGTRLTLTGEGFAEPSIRPHLQLYWNATLPLVKTAAERLLTTSACP
jgi:uncharacterized protein YndB with AHSA1/START domain